MEESSPGEHLSSQTFFYNMTLRFSIRRQGLIPSLCVWLDLRSACNPKNAAQVMQCGFPGYLGKDRAASTWFSWNTCSGGGHLLCQKSHRSETCRLDRMFGALSTVPAKPSIPAMLAKGLDRGLKKPHWLLVFEPTAAGVTHLRSH